MMASDNDLVIVRSTIDLAHNLGLRVCTEGVESRAALDLLEVLNSDRCQGFFISRPLPPSEIEGFVTRWNSLNPGCAGHEQGLAALAVRNLG